MKKLTMLFVLSLVTTLSVIALSFDIDENKDVDLNGIKKIIFDLNAPDGARFISTDRQTYSINGDGKGRILELSLKGGMNSNNKKAAPSLYVDKTDSILTVKLYKDRAPSLGFMQTGSIHFEAALPEYFDGEIDVVSSSKNISVTNLNTKILKTESSSGDITVASIEAETILFTASSGKTTANDLSAIKNIVIHSSSGDVELTNLLSEKAEVKASSGKIVVNRMRTTKELSINANSGMITANFIEGRSVSLDTDSGKISVKRLKAKESSAETSSGAIAVSKLDSGNAYFKSSSGQISIDVEKLSGDIDVGNGSGDVDIMIPAETGFDVDLTAYAGKIRSAFKLLGEVNGNRKNEVIGAANGGGHRIMVKASSGHINIKEK